jgi:hypothetical protein
MNLVFLQEGAEANEASDAPNLFESGRGHDAQSATFELRGYCSRCQRWFGIDTSAATSVVYYGCQACAYPAAVIVVT